MHQYMPADESWKNGHVPEKSPEPYVTAWEERGWNQYVDQERLS